MPENAQNAPGRAEGQERGCGTLTRAREPQGILARQMSERELSDNVVALARLLGWRVYRVWNSQHSPAGWPDLFCVRDGVALAAELKREGRMATVEQTAWLGELSRAGILTTVWRPSDWLSGEVERVLRLTRTEEDA